MYSLKNRVCAFIYLADTFVKAETHTKCVIEILMCENIVKNERDFERQMRNPSSKRYIDSIVTEIEEQSIFGEFTIYNGRMVLVVFEQLNSLEVFALKNKSKENFGDIPLYYLNLENNNRNLVELYG